MNTVKYRHTNLITKDWRRIASFYVEVFGCVQVGPLRKLSGRSVEDGTGVTNAVIEGVHLKLPGYESDGPTLEVFQYSDVQDQTTPLANSRGYGHIAFEVSDMNDICKKIIREGGWMLGKVACQPVCGVGVCTFIYARDPDQNIIEIQSWVPYD